MVCIDTPDGVPLAEGSMAGNIVWAVWIRWTVHDQHCGLESQNSPTSASTGSSESRP
jgi:hypothetical protein